MTKEIFELLARCETEMRYAGWIHPEADNPQRQELYIAVCEALAAQPPLPVQPQRQWVGLTDDDVLQIRETVQVVEGRSLLVSMTIAIEQALKEKNT